MIIGVEFVFSVGVCIEDKEFFMTEEWCVYCEVWIKVGERIEDRKYNTNFKTRWKHSDRGNERLNCSKNEETTRERVTGAAPEYCGSPTCSGTWLILI
jgi:hypothetical protein